jgi:hypothetical protein
LPPEHLSCQEVVELVTDYLERAMPADMTSLFEEHLNFCDGCEWYLGQMRATVAVAGRIQAEALPPEARDRLLTAFRDWRHA